MKTRRMTRAQRTLRVRAIRSAWAIARRAGLCAKLPRMDGLMDTDERVRRAIVRAFECGYRNGRKDAQKGVGMLTSVKDKDGNDVKVGDRVATGKWTRKELVVRVKRFSVGRDGVDRVVVQSDRAYAQGTYIHHEVFTEKYRKVEEGAVS